MYGSIASHQRSKRRQRSKCGSESKYRNEGRQRSKSEGRDTNKSGQKSRNKSVEVQKCNSDREKSNEPFDMSRLDKWRSSKKTNFFLRGNFRQLSN